MNPKKCTFTKQVEYLGYIIAETTKKKKIDLDKIRAI